MDLITLSIYSEFILVEFVFDISISLIFSRIKEFFAISSILSFFKFCKLGFNACK